MYNRYRGNSGKPEKMEEPRRPAPKSVPVPRQSQSRPPKGNLSALLPKNIGRSLSELETEDLLLILILYLMYRESGDKELLLIMGAMYLL